MERVSLSVYRNNIVLKGGILIASIIGASKRSTLDIDSTLKNIELSEESIRTIVQEIINIDINKRNNKINNEQSDGVHIQYFSFIMYIR